jgi:hypothetical protein
VRSGSSRSFNRQRMDRACREHSAAPRPVPALVRPAESPGPRRHYDGDLVPVLAPRVGRAAVGQRLVWEAAAEGSSEGEAGAAPAGDRVAAAAPAAGLDEEDGCQWSYRPHCCKGDTRSTGAEPDQRGRMS